MSEEALCDPTDCSLPGSSVHGFPRQEYCSELPFPTPGDLPDPRIEPSSQADSLPLTPPGKPHSQQSLWRERAKGKVLCVLPPRQEEGWSHVEGWERPKEVAVHRENPRMRSFLLHMRLEKILENWDMWQWRWGPVEPVVRAPPSRKQGPQAKKGGERQEGCGAEEATCFSELLEWVWKVDLLQRMFLEGDFQFLR